MSRRAEIAMTAAEVAAFIGDQRVVTCATVGRDGWPHLMPLWFAVRDGLDLRGIKQITQAAKPVEVKA